MAKSTSIAKITRPRLPDVLPRTRLFHLLDQTRKKFPAIWISGPAGAGKTTLVSSYLDSRELPCLWYQVDERDAYAAPFFQYMTMAAGTARPGKRLKLPEFRAEYTDVAAFARQYFEELYRALPAGLVLVLDNCQHAEGSPPLQEILRAGLDQVNDGFLCILVSRGGLLPSLAPLKAQRKVSGIGWDSLRMTEEESRDMIRIQWHSGVPPQTVHRLHELADGWAAGLVLLTCDPAKEKAESMTAPALSGKTEVFDFFAAEIFDKMDMQTRSFLLISAFLPRMTPDHALQLTNIDHAGDILSRLHRSNYFTERKSHDGDIYTYHPLFRSFLLSRARRDLSRDEINRIQRSAAELLERSGQFEDAVELHASEEDWDALAGTIIRTGKQLTADGRHGMLSAWIDRVPEHVRERSPWLQYWYAVALFPRKPSESRIWFEKALRLFREQDELTGAFLAWTGMLESIVFAFEGLGQIDQWISFPDDLLAGGKPLPPGIETRVSTAMLMALVYRQPDHPRFNYWVRRALMSSRSLNLDALQYLGYYYFYTGRLTAIHRLAIRIFDAVKIIPTQPLDIIKGKLVEVLYCIITGPRNEVNSRALTEGLALGDRYGVHWMDVMFLGYGLLNALNGGDLRTRDFCRARLKEYASPMKPWERGIYHFAMGMDFLFEGDVEQAQPHAEAAFELARRGGPPFSESWTAILLAHVLHARNQPEAAEACLSRCGETAIRAVSEIVTYERLMSQAYFLFKWGRTQEAGKALAEGLALGKKYKYTTSFFAWPPHVRAFLYVRAQGLGIETGYVQDLIKKFNLLPDQLAEQGAAWSRPVKIFTLGRFGLELEGNEVTFEGKTPKKPLELLKAISALGGKEVSEGRIIDSLWPEASGDLAYKAFEMALQRLRKLIGNDKAVRRQEGKLTLDPRYCWTDLWAFEQLVLDAEQDLRDENRKQSRERGKKTSKAERLEKAIGLYKGHFLPSDTREPWLTVPRERLRSKFLRIVTKAGELYEQEGEWKKAMDCFERGLERDPACEEFYQHLMLCHTKLGNRTEAVKAYDRCRAALEDALGLEPSTRTEEILASIRKKV